MSAAGRVLVGEASTSDTHASAFPGSELGEISSAALGQAGEELERSAFESDLCLFTTVVLRNIPWFTYSPYTLTSEGNEAH